MSVPMPLFYHFARAGWVFPRLKGDALRDYQDRRAKRMVRYAAEHSPFYRELYQGHDLDDWQSLPTIDKQAMMANFDRLNTRGVTKDAAMETALRAERERDFAPTINDLTVGLSSGTSGHRGLFLVSPAETAAWAGTILSRTLHGIPPRGYRIAFFLRSNSNLYEKVGASQRVQFRYFDLMMPLPEAVAQLNVYAPQMLVGPPSLLLMLADFIEAGCLLIRPERVISVAEVLEPQDKARLERIFQVAVHQVYQSTEGLLAVSCPHGNLHVQEDLVALQYEPVAPDDPKRVTPIITDLWRTTQPILRYRLGDILHLSDVACPCGSGFQVLERIEGRSDDVCQFPATDGTLRPVFPDTIRRMILLAHAAITDYVAVQASPGHLRIHLEPTEDAAFDTITVAVRQSVNETLEMYGCHVACLEIERGLPPVTPGAKRRRVVVQDERRVP